MTGAHGIDVQLLHNADVLLHAFHRDHVAAIRVEFVTVGTLDENGLTIDQQLSTLDFNMAEAHTLANDLHHFIAFASRDVQRIEIRRLCRPRLCTVELNKFADTFSHQFTCRIIEIHRNLKITRSLHVDIQRGLTVGIVLFDDDIFDMNLRTGIEVYLAGNTCKAPKVLILQIRAVAPAHHLHSD